MGDSTTPDSPYWPRLTENWALAHHRQHHNEALYMLGEHAIFVLTWHLEDFNQGLVDRCSVCYTSFGKIAEAYGQTADTKCPSCFGTTYEGGIKQIVVRPSLWDYTEMEESEEQRRGIQSTQTANVQAPADVGARRGDWIIRRDNSRWQIQGDAATRVRTGFSFPESPESYIGGTFSRVVKEAETSIAYQVPPIAPGDVADLIDESIKDHRPGAP